MTKIYLIRHGEAEGNLYRRMQGDFNGGLTGLGYQQVEALGERFRDIHLDGVYSSDLFRAMYTASVLCLPRNLPLHTDPRLREVNVGPWEDMPYGNAMELWPEEMRHFSQSPMNWHLEGADTFPGIAERGVAALQDIARENPDKTVAVCAHSYLIGAVLCKLFYGYDHYDQVGRSENTAVSLLTVEEGQFQLQFKHDSSHLDKENLHRNRWVPDSSDSPAEISMADLGFAPLTDIEEYIRYRKDAWELIYGSLRGFNGSGFWLDAQNTIGPDPGAMVVAYLGKTPVGMLQLSPQRDAHKKVGYIPFIYLREPYRHKGLGIQLIGYAVSFYRALGRTRLQLSVAHTNENAIAFYEKFGFQAVGKTKGLFGKLILMEKDFSLPPLPKKLRIIPRGH